MGLIKFLIAMLFLNLSFSLKADTLRTHLGLADNEAGFIPAKSSTTPYLAQILTDFSRQTGVVIHYSVLPPITAQSTCALSSISAWLYCLLGKNANLVFRYEHLPTGQKSERVAEVWIVPEPFEDTRPSMVSAEQAEPNLTVTWFERIRVKNPQQRVDAVADLASQAINNRPELQDALELAFSDPNAEVRVQAIGGLAKLNNERALNVLHSALLDKDVSVRLMAVDNAGNNTALLEQALNDNDESVRSFAALKLNTLERQP